MSNVTYHYVERKKSESGQTGDITYDLPESGFMPELYLIPFSTPTASTDPALPLSEAITKVEIMDGGEVIKSYSANQLKGLAMIHGRRELASPELNDNAVEGHDFMPIVLGKKINGINYAPDMGRFSNPQIKISWDNSLTTSAYGATFDADASPAMKFTLLAKLVRDTNLYTAGYIKTTQLKIWTQATSTTTTVDIPEGEELLGIGFAGGYDAKDFTDDLNEVKLDFDNGKWIPLDIKAEEVIAVQQLWFGSPFRYTFAMDLIDAVEIDTHMGYLLQITGTAGSSAGRVFEMDGIHKGVEAVGFMDAATPSTISTYETVQIESVGWCPFGIWYLPASALTDGASDTIDTGQYKKIKLSCVSGSSASTSSTPVVLGEFLVKQ